MGFDVSLHITTQPERLMRRRTSARAGLAAGGVFLAGLVLSGCSGSAQATFDAGRAGSSVGLEGNSEGVVDPASFAGDVQIGISDTLVARGRQVPFDVFMGLSPASDTRLAAKAFLDLRGLQRELPYLLSGTIEPSCSIALDLEFVGAEADGEVLNASAVVNARLFRCPDDGTVADRGPQILAQTIDATARIGQRLSGRCIEFEVEDLDLSARGVLGALANLFGVTGRTRTALLEKAQAALDERPICPDLPEAVLALDPHFDLVRLEEVGDGGMGVAIAGSLEISARSLLALLALDPSLSRPASSSGIEFRLDDAIAIRGTDVGFGVDVRLSEGGRTRMGVEAVLDLREVQRRLPELSKEIGILDLCGRTLTLERLDASVSGATLFAEGKLHLTKYLCERTAPDTWRRGGIVTEEDIGLSAGLATELVDGCVMFRVDSLAPDAAGEAVLARIARDEVLGARAILEDTARLLLETRPLCPKLPPLIAVLDPRLEQVQPREIGEGGIGLASVGSIAVDPRSVIDVLRLLQERGSIPPAP